MYSEQGISSFALHELPLAQIVRCYHQMLLLLEINRCPQAVASCFLVYVATLVGRHDTFF